MSLDPCAVPHPSVPNVRDLAEQVATLSRALDVCVIALARAHGISETTVRHNMGLPPGNPWRTRRAEQDAGRTESVVQATIYTFQPTWTDEDANGAQTAAGEAEYAI